MADTGGLVDRGAAAMVPFARWLAQFVRAVAVLAALGCLGLWAIELYRFHAPREVPLIGPWTFFEFAVAALVIAVAAHVIDRILSRSDRDGA
jgi:magnesium-transporting ATPase (P-type)